MRLTVSQEEILKCNILQYSLTRERRSEERWERRKRRRMAKRGEGEEKRSRKGRDLDFYHGSILVLRQRLPSLTSSQSSSPCSFPVSRSRTISPTLSEEVTWQLLFAFLSYWRKYLIKFRKRRHLEGDQLLFASPCRLRPTHQNLYSESYFAKQCLESTPVSSNSSMDVATNNVE